MQSYFRQSSVKCEIGETFYVGLVCFILIYKKKWSVAKNKEKEKKVIALSRKYDGHD